MSSPGGVAALGRAASEPDFAPAALRGATGAASFSDPTMKSTLITTVSIYGLGVAISFAVAGVIKIIGEMIRNLERRAKKVTS